MVMLIQPFYPFTPVAAVTLRRHISYNIGSEVGGLQKLEQVFCDMKRRMEEVRGMVGEWVHDRQPDWEDLRRMEGEEEEEDVVMNSRRRQHRLDTQPESLCEEVEAPGAPKRKRRRVLPWTEQGRLLWPGGGDEAIVLVEDSQAGSSCGEEEREDSQTLRESSSGCVSFVVDDDSESLADEEKESERRLGKAALEDVRFSLRGKIQRLKVRLDTVEEELAGMATPGSVTSVESETWLPLASTCIE
jgi:predicted nuclease with TOPRIM domain